MSVFGPRNESVSDFKPTAGGPRPENRWSVHPGPVDVPRRGPPDVGPRNLTQGSGGDRRLHTPAGPWQGDRNWSERTKVGVGTRTWTRPHPHDGVETVRDPLAGRPGPPFSERLVSTT